MKRIRIDDEWHEYGSSRPKSKKDRSRRPIDDHNPSNPVFASIMEEISTAAAAERAGWAQLEKYLATGTAPARPRIRIRT